MKSKCCKATIISEELNDLSPEGQTWCAAVCSKCGELCTINDEE